MPPVYVKTIREEIYYEYAKLISRSVHGSIQYGFVTDCFLKLRDGQMAMSGRVGERESEEESPRACVFCGCRSHLSTVHLVPRNRGGGDSGKNLVLACRSCRSSRGDKGVFEWLGLKKKDRLHCFAAGKYLKQLLAVHELARTADIRVEQLAKLCSKCPLPEVCKQWDKVGELTCFCLESVLPKRA